MWLKVNLAIVIIKRYVNSDMVKGRSINDDTLKNMNSDMVKYGYPNLTIAILKNNVNSLHVSNTKELSDFSSLPSVYYRRSDVL